MSNQRQPDGWPPAGPLESLLQHAGDKPGEQRREERQPDQRMTFGAMQRHVSYGIAMVKKHIQIGQRAAERAHQRRLPEQRASAHDSHRHRRAENQLRNGIHACSCVET